MMRTGAEVLVGLKKRADFKGPKLEDMVNLSRRRAEKNGVDSQVSNLEE